MPCLKQHSLCQMRVRIWVQESFQHICITARRHKTILKIMWFGNINFKLHPGLSTADRYALWQFSGMFHPWAEIEWISYSFSHGLGVACWLRASFKISENIARGREGPVATNSSPFFRMRSDFPCQPCKFAACFSILHYCFHHRIHSCQYKTTGSPSTKHKLYLFTLCSDSQFNMAPLS